ncbi:MAG: MFS transporter [Actinobacteria bacterium]|uniref:Unannotated protein n=1 Tax=freshwater metagenome TaxID=449393 RepID=A0A6J5ZIA6_9ZZZZ|nr:MFS transporter [Actinomycetota bacterium]
MPQFLIESTPHVRRFLIGALFNALGGGLTLPLLVVYLHQVRGLSLTSASLVLSWMAVTGLWASPIIGAIVDRAGPRVVLLCAILVEALGTIAWPLVHTTYQAIAVSTVVAIGSAGIWPPQTTMMARMVSEEFRQKFFGFQFMALNLGLGLGGIIGSLIVRIEDPSTFTTLYIVDGLTYIIFFLFVLSLRGTGGKLTADERGSSDIGSYREVFADRRLIKISVMSVLLLTCGYASLDAGMPVLMTTVGGLKVSDLGLVWAVNTFVIVLLQISILNRLEGKSRTRLLAVVGALWSLSWILIAIGISIPRWTFLFACIAIAVFALGETVWSPIGAALQNVIAPEHLRGRYNAIGGQVWVVAGTLGPAFSGLMMQHKLELEWLALLAIGCLIAGYLGIGLKRELSAYEDGTELEK